MAKAKKLPDTPKEKRKGNYKAGPGAPPFAWTDEFEDEITEYIATHPKSMRQICDANPHWPQMNIIYERMNKSKRFGEQYLVAKQRQVNCFNDETFEILNEVKADPELVGWGKLAVHQRNWQASRLQPKTYGDKSEQIALTNQDVLSKQNAELKDMIAKLLAEREKPY